MDRREFIQLGVMGLGCGSRQLVERSKFGDMAYKIGANL